MSEIEKESKNREYPESNKTIKYLAIHLGLIIALGAGVSGLDSRIASNRQLSALNVQGHPAPQEEIALLSSDSTKVHPTAEKSVEDFLHSKQNDLINFLLNNQDLSLKLLLSLTVLLGPHVVYALSENNQLTMSAQVRE